MVSIGGLLAWRRVPQELPMGIHELMQQCQDVDPKLRPSAKQVFECLNAHGQA